MWKMFPLFFHLHSTKMPLRNHVANKLFDEPQLLLLKHPMIRRPVSSIFGTVAETSEFGTAQPQLSWTEFLTCNITNATPPHYIYIYLVVSQNQTAPVIIPAIQKQKPKLYEGFPFENTPAIPWTVGVAQQKGPKASFSLPFTVINSQLDGFCQPCTVADQPVNGVPKPWGVASANRPLRITTDTTMPLPLLSSGYASAANFHPRCRDGTSPTRSPVAGIGDPLDK